MNSVLCSIHHDHCTGIAMIVTTFTCFLPVSAAVCDFYWNATGLTALRFNLEGALSPESRLSVLGAHAAAAICPVQRRVEELPRLGVPVEGPGLKELSAWGNHGE